MGNDRSNLAGKMPKSNAEKIACSSVLRESMLRSVFRALKLPVGSYGLDAGCGIGIPAWWLAEAIAPGGHVIGVDLSSEYLTQAREIIQKANLSEYVSFREGDMNSLAFEDDTFDWALSIDAVWSERPVKELARVVKPGGIVAILNWSSQQVLPGYPLLEARLNSTPSGIAPFVRGMKPESHVLRALGWLRDAGLTECKSGTFVGEVYAPLSEDIIIAMLSLFEMRWEGAQSELSAEDWAEYQRLCQPESPDFILDSPDYYAFFTYSLFYGSKSS